MTTVVYGNGGAHRALALRVLGLAAIVLLASCGVPGSDGQSYVALDYSVAPEAIYFPSFPQTVFFGEYYEHAAGDHSGEYIAWDGTYWWFTYTILIDEGGEAPLFGVGDHGDDYYFSIWLYSFGPSLYEDDVVVRSVSPHGGASPAAVSPADEHLLRQNGGVMSRPEPTDAEVTVVTQTRTIGALTIRLEARGYRD